MELMEQLRNGSFKRSDILKIIRQVGGDLIQYTDFWFNSLSSSSSCFSWPPHDVAGTVDIHWSNSLILFLETGSHRP